MNREETNCLKALAIILMFWHHLFGCGAALTGGTEYIWYLSMGDFGNMFAYGAKICIALFTFSSGIGLYHSYLCKDNPVKKIIARTIKFLITYWTIMFLVAIPYLIIVHSFDLSLLLINLFALLHNDSILYVSLSWYIKVYLEILLVLPIVKLISCRIRTPLVDLFWGVLLPAYIANFLPSAEESFITMPLFLLSSLKLLLQYFPVFYSGVLFEKYEIAKKITLGDNFSLLRKIVIVITSVVVMIGVVYVWGKGYFYPITDALTATLFTIAFIYFYRLIIQKCSILNKILAFIGLYSFQYWLLSGMFYLNTTELTWILYLPKISVLICVWNFLILTPFALALGKISGKISGMITKYILRA